MAIVVLLVTIVSIGFMYEHGLAKAKKEILPASIAVVNVEYILGKSNKQDLWRQQMEAEESKIRAELQKMSAEIDAIEADANTRKVGSSDYLGLMRQIMEGRAVLEAKTKYYEQATLFKIEQRTGEFYGQVRAVISDVAQKRGIDIVVAKEDFDSSRSSVRELMTFIRTSKVLYHTADVDITSDVLTALDKAK